MSPYRLQYNESESDIKKFNFLYKNTKKTEHFRFFVKVSKIENFQKPNLIFYSMYKFHNSYFIILIKLYIFPHHIVGLCFSLHTPTFLLPPPSSHLPPFSLLHFSLLQFSLLQFTSLHFTSVYFTFTLLHFNSLHFQCRVQKGWCVVSPWVCSARQAMWF